MTFVTYFQLLFDAAVLHLPYSKLKRELERADRHGLRLGYEILKHHHQADGNITAMVDGLIYAQEHGLTISPKNACARELFARFRKQTLTGHLQEIAAAGIRDFDRAPLRIEDIGQPQSRLHRPSP